MAKVINKNKRCTVSEIIMKEYHYDTSFKKEKKAYAKLEGKGFIPKIIYIDCMHKIIIMEKIDGLPLVNYANKNKKIPYDFAKKLKCIKEELLKDGIYNNEFKPDHIFIDEQTNDIRIIDFDVYDDIDEVKDNPGRIKKLIEDQINDEFDLNNKKSKDEFKIKYFSGINSEIIDDFFNNAKK